MTTPSTGEAEHRRLSAGMRALLWVAATLVFLAGVQLFVFTERTDEYFAWTIEPSLTAAFLGAGYWASVVFEARAAVARTWVEARIAIPAVFVFTTLTLIVTLVHIENFHLGAEFELATRAVTWFWIFIYVVVPIVMAALWVGQARDRRPDPPPRSPLPTWLAVIVGVQAVVLLLLGAYLLLAPEEAADLWPWELSALTGRAIGAWVFSLGVAAAHALVERDIERLQPAAWAYLAFGGLQALALVRYPDTPEWGDPPAPVYVAFLVSVVVVGAAAVWLHRSRVARAG